MDTTNTKNDDEILRSKYEINKYRRSIDLFKRMIK